MTFRRHRRRNGLRLLVVLLLVKVILHSIYGHTWGGGGGVAQLVVVPLAMGRGAKSPGFDSHRGLSFQKGRERMGGLA